MPQKWLTLNLMPVNDSYDRIQTILDEKQRAIFLSEMERIMPSVGIHDEPTRCFRFNLEWCKIVIGWLLWMTDIAFWKDAQDESYSAIRQMLIALEGSSCAGELAESGDCYSYPAYAPFISYSPMNPFVNPNEIPNEYLVSPFQIYDGNGSLPPYYHAGDVIVPLAAINLDPFDVFGGALPTIQVRVVGSGQIEADLLRMPQGGVVIVSYNGAPSVLDIITAFFTETTDIYSLNLDLLAIPPQESPTMSLELNINEPAGVETVVFFTFAPILDDSFLPLRFGGGLRQISLCGFENAGVIMGFTDLRVNNCNIEVMENGLWVNKGSILACVQGITNPMQTQIDQNTVNITNNQNAITTNANNITTLIGRVDGHDSDIQQHNLTLAYLQQQITSNDGDIAGLGLDIQQHNLTLNDHETRITALENAPASGGGGGGGTSVKMRVEEHIDSLFVTTSFDFYDITIPSGYDDIIVYIRTKNEDGFTRILAYINDNLTNTDYRAIVDGGTVQDMPYISQFNTATVETNGWFHTRIYFVSASKNQRQLAYSESIYSTDINGTPTNFNNAWQTDFTTTISKIRIATSRLCDAGTEIHTFGIKTIDVLVPSPTILTDPIVTFDSDSAPYTLTPSQVGIVSSGGNPLLCLYNQSVAVADYLEVEINLGTSKQINAISLSLFASNTEDVTCWFSVDGGIIAGKSAFQNTDNLWQAFNFNAASFPQVGQIVRVKIENNGVTSSPVEIRVDNIFIDTA